MKVKVIDLIPQEQLDKFGKDKEWVMDCCCPEDFNLPDVENCGCGTDCIEECWMREIEVEVEDER